MTNKTPRPVPVAPLDTQQRYTIPEASCYLRQSRAKTYTDIRDGNLRVIKDAKRSYVPGTEIARRSRLESAA